MTVLLALAAAVIIATGNLDEHRWTSLVRLLERADPRRAALLRERRLALPGLVDAIAAALASGLSIPQAFAEVAASLPPALAHATQRTAASLVLGDSIESAVGAYVGVVPQTDLAPFAIVLAAFARNGGRIGRSLARVAALLRGRLALEEEREALTAQGRMSAVVLVSLAPFGAMFFAAMMPEYLTVLFGQGRWLLVAACVLETAGAIWLWRILRSTTLDADFASLLDAVIVGLDAGLTFELALSALVARAPTLSRMPEARRLLADLALGRGRHQAFASFGAAGPTEARVASLVLVGTRFGSPLSEMLVAQADVLRAADRRRAEAHARRLPVLMLFPLAFCILPALLAVFLGPPLLSLVG